MISPKVHVGLWPMAWRLGPRALGPYLAPGPGPLDKGPLGPLFGPGPWTLCIVRAWIHYIWVCYGTIIQIRKFLPLPLILQGTVEIGSEGKPDLCLPVSKSPKDINLGSTGVAQKNKNACMVNTHILEATHAAERLWKRNQAVT